MIKRNFIAFIIFLVLISVAGLFYFSDRNSTFSPKETGFALNDTSMVNEIIVNDTSTTFKLIKKGGSWFYNSTFTVKPALMNLCYKIISQVEIKSPVPKASMAVIAGKIKQEGHEIIIQNNEKVLRHYYVWADISDSSIYMLQARNHIPFLVTLPSFNGNFTRLFRAGPDFWRDLTILRYFPGQIASVRVVQSGNQSQSFELSLSGKGMATLTDIESKKKFHFSKEAVEAYLFCFRNIRVQQFYENPSGILKILKNEQPQYVITITDRSGKTSIIKTFKKPTGQKLNGSISNQFDLNFCYILLNNREVALAKYIEIDPLTRNLGFFLK